jgi:predicted CopG family antitoxin
MNNSNNNNKITTIEVTQDTLDSLRKFAKPGDETFNDIIQGLIEYRLEDRNTIFREAQFNTVVTSQ